MFSLYLPESNVAIIAQNPPNNSLIFTIVKSSIGAVCYFIKSKNKIQIVNILIRNSFLNKFAFLTFLLASQLIVPPLF